MNGILARIGPPIRALRGVIGNRSLRRAELAFTLFNLAEAATWTAILVYAFDQGGTSATGLVGLLLLVPAGIVAPLASTLGDRFGRARLVRLGYSTQACTVGATGVAIVLDAPALLVYGLAALAAASMTTSRPGHHSLLPDLASTAHELTAGNSVSSLAEGIGASAGTVVVAILLATTGVGAVFVVASGALVVAAVLAFRVHAAHAEPAAGRVHPLAVVAEAVEGFRAVAHARSPRLLVVLSGTMTVTWGLFDVLLVTLAIEELGIGEAGVGVLHTAMGVGALVGAAGSVALVGRRSMVPALIGATLLYGVSIAATGSMEVAIAAVITVFLSGAGVTLFDVTTRVLLQRVVDDAVLTRVFGALESVWTVAVGIGSALSAVLVAAFGVAAAFAIAGAVLPLLVVATLAGLRRVDREAVVPERELALLRGIPMFAVLPRSDMERVAVLLQRFVVPRGNDVVVQGDIGDSFYVIDAGAFEVAIDGRVVRTLEEGDHFGEIALLHDVPRTATVHAVADGAVWALDRDAFLATVTGMPQAHAEAEAVSATRLQENEAGSGGERD